MAFKSYLALPEGNGCWLLTAPEPIRLSGSHGLVARHLATVPVADLNRWTRSDREWLEQQDPSTAADRWIVFEQLENNHLVFSRLLQINGASAHGQTELLLKLVSLSCGTAGGELRVSCTGGAKSWNEELGLDGDPRRADSSWKWCERAVHVGTSTFGTTAR